MRETASLGSSYRRQYRLPASLMQRLAMMQHLALLAKAQAEGKPASAPAGRRGPCLGTQAVVLAWFSLGVLTSGAAGVGTLMGLRALEARGTPVTWRAVGATVGTAWSAAWDAAWAKVPTTASAPKPAGSPDRGWERVEVAIARSARAPLTVQVTGADDLPVDVVLDGVPAGVRPSRGTPVGPSTWVLSRADLKGLYLALDDTAPDAFDLRIGVSAPPGIAAGGSIVQVRLVGGGARMQAASDGRGRAGAEATPSPAYADTSRAAATPAAAATARGYDDARHPTAQERDVAATADTTAPATPPAATAAGRTWPEGASALGAVPHERKETGWSTPPPVWSPFEDGPQHP